MDHGHSHGGSWDGTPTYEEQKGNYPFVAKNLDVVKGWLDGDFKTRRVFFEYYWGLSEIRDDLDPKKNHLIQVIRKWEEQDAQVDYILICREYDLAIQRGKMPSLGLLRKTLVYFMRKIMTTSETCLKRLTH